jgi:hypothetical protein
MAEKKQDTFIVNDRRLFTSEGEARAEVAAEKHEVSSLAPPRPAAVDMAPPAAAGEPVTSDIPAPPTATEQQTQADAYQKSTRALDEELRGQFGARAQELEMTFERFLASLYMSALLQLGLAQEPDGQPRIDLIGARQTIDTISLLADKTKGNLTSAEQNFLQNALYELRMAYLEVTNVLSRTPPPGAATGSGAPGSGAR